MQLSGFSACCGHDSLLRRKSDGIILLKGDFDSSFAISQLQSVKSRLHVHRVAVGAVAKVEIILASLLSGTKAKCAVLIDV
jgi:hypothetical protein